MKILDLCCGRGGWSKPFIELGHDVTGVDITNFGYEGKFIKSDILDFVPKEKYDIVLASPPCGEFSIIKRISPKHPAYPRHGFDLVQAVFRVIDLVKPKYYLVENVPGLEEYLGPPNQKIRYGKSRKWAYLWTNIPQLGFFSNSIEYKVDWSANDKKTSQSIRAEIPYPLSKAVAESVLTK